MKLKEKLSDLLKNNEGFRLLACVLSGIFSSVPFFIDELFIIEWVSVIPLFYILFSSKKVRFYKAFLYGAIFHFSKSVIVLSWLKELTSMSALDVPPYLMIGIIIVAIIGLSALQAIPFGTSCMFINILKNKKTNLILLILTTSLLFTASELVNTIAEQYGFIGFPWVLTYVSQVAFSAGIQSASLFGSHFISFIVFFANASLAVFLITSGKVQKICAILSLLLFTTNISYGIITLLPTDKSNDSINVLAYQDNISSYSKWDTPATSTLDDFIYDMESTYDKSSMPDIIVLSETVFPVRLNSGSSGRYITNALCDFTEKYNNVVVAGSFLYTDEGRYNAQFFFDNGKLNDTVYKKRTLVPFGEYVPAENFLIKLFPFMEQFNLSGNSLTPGNNSEVADLSFTKIGGMICYDSIFYYNTRQSAKDGAQILVLSTNDSWYNDSAAAYHHFAHSKFRAIETRKPVIRGATTGISGIIDECGRTLDSTKLLVKDTATSFIIPNSYVTLFVKFGYTWYYLLFVADIILIFINHIKRRKQK